MFRVYGFRVEGFKGSRGSVKKSTSTEISRELYRENGKYNGNYYLGFIRAYLP